MVGKTNYYTQHNGRVVEMANDGHCSVEIIPSSDNDCDGCSIRAFCGSASKRSILIDAITDVGVTPPKPGDMVTVAVNRHANISAITTLIVIPLTVLLMTAVVLDSLGMNELISGLSAIVVAILSYIPIFFIYRKKSPQWVIVK